MRSRHVDEMAHVRVHQAASRFLEDGLGEHPTELIFNQQLAIDGAQSVTEAEIIDKGTTVAH
jgi:hypothetical protein